jgi:hypothetical protein
MNPQTLQELNLSSDFRYPGIQITSEIGETIATAMQRSLGRTGTRIEFPTEDVVRILKMHSHDEQTLVEFGNEYITVEHANAIDNRLDWYKRVVEDIARLALKTMGVQFIFEQRHTVSKTLAMLNNADSRPFLAEHVAKFRDEALSKFGQPLGGMGLRFFWPSVDNKGIPSQFDLKIESYLPDPKLIFLLAKGRFLCLPPIDANHLTEVTDAISKVDNVITQLAINFLGQFEV